MSSDQIISLLALRNSLIAKRLEMANLALELRGGGEIIAPGVKPDTSIGQEHGSSLPVLQDRIDAVERTISHEEASDSESPQARAHLPMISGPMRPTYPLASAIPATILPGCVRPNFKRHDHVA